MASICENLQFSSTASLLRHEHDAHVMYGYEENLFLCTHPSCDRSVTGHGFSRHWQLRDHKRFAHNHPFNYRDEIERSLHRDEGRTEILAPFTDSGYKSAPNLEHYPCVQFDAQESLHLPNVLAMCNEDVDEAKTSYSLGSTVDLSTTRKYIADLSSDMFGKLRKHFVDPTNRTVLSKILPELIKAFAVKICHDYPSQENRNITSFVHKRHR